MGHARVMHDKVKLFFGILASSEDLIPEAGRRLGLDFSEVEDESPVTVFSHTDYYAKEMGSRILRKWFSVRLPIFPDELVDIKQHTNLLEQVYADDGHRRLNLDPGYVSASKVVLASTKDHAHRIYVGRGIYEEVTLHYRRGIGFEPWPWTYPDYRTPEALAFFEKVRVRLRTEGADGRSDHEKV
ncbi:MAG: DUF4416 family protein [Candidatus Sumerlaeaceae bacterium]|nr:DUF4416 family protein [Candidatus Sumerlaeaceae bacterium]